MKAIVSGTGLVMVGVIAVGCSIEIGGGGSGGPLPTSTAIRVAHGSPGVAAFDVCVGNTLVLRDARFGEITDYAEDDVRAGRTTFRMVDAGGSCSDVVGDDITLILSSKDASTIVTFADRDAIPLEDDVTVVSLGKTRIRVINASPDSIEIDVEDAGNGITYFDDVDYAAAADFAYKEINAGTYDLQITPSTAEEDPLPLGETELREGHVYTLFVFGYVDPAEGEPEFAAELVDDGIAGVGF